MNIYLVEGTTVYGHQGTYSNVLTNILRQWRHSVRGRVVYTLNKGNWYQLSNAGSWASITKPKVIEMAELINSITPIKLKDIQDGVSSDSFWAK